jgi:5-methylcytosine-specific restriction endonuclease McrA
MNTVNYLTYIKSPRWKAKRKIVLERDGFACRICDVDGAYRRLHVHHRSYRRLNTTAELNDCVTLCDNCHNMYHRNGVTTRR